MLKNLVKMRDFGLKTERINMFNIGLHLSASKGFMHMGKEALSIGANTFQFFTRNPRGGQAKEIDMDDITSFIAFQKEHHWGPILAHASYTLNHCSDDPAKREFALNTMKDDLARLSLMPGQMYNFHPGSHREQGIETGIRYITEQLNAVLTPDLTTTVLLETMAGQGSEVGSKFEELRAIINGLNYKENVGVCLDTCHVFAGGYDIKNNLDGVLEHFDNIIGLDKLKAVHLNDCLSDFASHKDRHAKISAGTLGMAAIERIINHPALKHLPFYLETPNELPGYADEIKRLRAVYKSDAKTA